MNPPATSAIATINARVLLSVKVVDAGRGTIGSLVPGKTTVDPVCEAIAAVRPAFDECLAQRLRFESGEAELHRVLLAACEHGINRRYKDDSDVGGDE